MKSLLEFKTWPRLGPFGYKLYKDRARRGANLMLSLKKHTIVYPVHCALFYMGNDAEIFSAHYAWKVTEKGVFD